MIMARAFNQSLNAQANALRIKITLQQSPSPLPNYLNSEQSEKVYLQDPFAEYIIATPKPSNKARLSKMDTAISLLSGFSTEFQNAAYETRLQMASAFNHNLNDRNEPKLKQKRPQTDATDIEKKNFFLAKINTLQKTIDFESYRLSGDEMGRNTVGDKRDQIRRGSRHLQLAISSTSAVTSELECIDNNLLSGFWHMMEDESMINGFPLTTQGYNIYDDRRMDWLRRSYKLRMNKSYARKQCDIWMKNSPNQKLI